MKQVAFLLLFLSTAGFCHAQGRVSSGQNAVATSQIRVSIPSYAVINLGRNNKKNIAYNSTTDLKNVGEPVSRTEVLANDKWAVNVIRRKDERTKSAALSSAVPSYTVIYVTTRM